MISKFLTFFVLFTQVCFAQNNRDKRNSLIYAAQVSLYDKEYSQSLSYFTKAFKYAPPQTSYELLTAAGVALKLNNLKIADCFLKEAITKYNTPLDLINSYSPLQPYKNSKSIKNINKIYKSLVKEYYTNLKSISTFIEVENLVTKDQYVRSLPNYYLGVNEEQSGEMLQKYIDAVNNKDSLSINKYSKYIHFQDKNFEKLKLGLMKNTDSLNIQEYIDITKKYGYFENGWILLWHHRLTYGENNFIWNFFKPYITSQIDKGNIERDFFAAFEDEYNISRSGKQRFGTNTQYELFPIENIEEVDLFREKVGLPPLYYDKIIYNIDIPKEYKINEKKFRDHIFSKIKSL
ncbi:hypothetical protein [Chryseobacterium sp. HMWF035]|uniref:hypothetical protein n=2 Tax=unclassified Chryseobacterium TaxID=2593645 RepID=UPI000D582429|nr:hypothetical protein [Chryseobacterium sp. HMWF035]PVV53531.1 hypothetical protein DD829_18665 [Chryseobacterium sp. HMWF035]